MRPEHWHYTIQLRWRSLFRRRRADQELDDELRDHLDLKTELIRRSRDDARRSAPPRATGPGWYPSKPKRNAATLAA